jgi:hypothetical protein
VHLGDPIAISAVPGVIGEVDPAKLLEGGSRGEVVAEPVDTFGRRVRIIEIEAVSERDVVGTTGALSLDREADKVVLGHSDIHADEAHALVPPQLHRETRGGARI